MSEKDTKNLVPYEKIKNWPPFTYRDYPEVTPETLKAFIDFLETENNSNKRKALQPWIPFCTTKCNFCYFPTELGYKNSIETYLSAVKKVLDRYSKTKYVKTSEFSEIYLAGGTPSIMSTEQTKDLMSFCQNKFTIADNCEIKITGCTQDFDYSKLQALSEFGVDQLDLGIQTFDDNIRRMVNLFDKTKDAEETIKTAHNLGLRVSIDLMYNLPGQSLEIWNKDIQRALELNVESVDCYVLDVYPQTKIAEQLKSGELPPRGNEDMEKRMYNEAYTIFKSAGYKPTCHNRFSRIQEDFKEPCFETLGTGSGFFMGNLGDFSYTDIQPAESYVKAVDNSIFPISKLYYASLKDEMGKMMMRLYIRLPVNKEEFRNRFGILPEEAFKDTIEKLEKHHLIEIDDQEIRLTKIGDVWRYNICWEFSNNDHDQSL
ncbi:MAG: radical SAM protein [Candidatus Bathyarchaeota archaeon]